MALEFVWHVFLYVCAGWGLMCLLFLAMWVIRALKEGLFK